MESERSEKRVIKIPEGEEALKELAKENKALDDELGLQNWNTEILEGENQELQEENTALQAENAKQKEEYSKDPLTGAKSLPEFISQLDQSLKLTGRGQKAALLYIDVDRFKDVNDTYGHPIGDLVLKEVCAYLMKSVRTADIVARIGGEELAILLSGADKLFAANKAEELRVGIKKLMFDEHPDLKVTASFGVVALNSSMKAKEAREAADAAMYKAKESGRDQVVVHTNAP